MATTLRRYNGWLPSSPAVYDAFVKGLLKHASVLYGDIEKTGHAPSVEAFKLAVQANPVMVELFRNIFLQASRPMNKVHDFDYFLCLLDVIVVGPPKFQVANEGGQAVAEPIGVPMYLVFDILSNTSAAYDLFRMEEFNKALRELLRSWGEYLKTYDSSRTLTDKPDGWFSEASIELLEVNRGKFNQTYVVFSDDVNRGYNSWDEFFTRRVQPTARPLQDPGPDGANRVIYNACESTFERLQSNVQLHDQFWLKDGSYSLYDMFHGDKDTAERFVGGTVYQAFLSPQDYHRWHSPIAGTVVDARVVNGTYYAALPDKGDLPDDGAEGNVGDNAADPRGALIRSQPWLTVAATRAIITIRGSSPHIGLVGFIGVGMAEVSSCELLVQKGQHVKPGQQIGMFHFRGSSHALIFDRNTPIRFLTDEEVVGKDKHIQVNRIIGVSVAQ